MSKIDSITVRKGIDYAESYFRKNTPVTFIYHNIGHTQAVADNAALIARKEGLSAEETNKILLAAWFHDIGYLVDYMNHELRSTEEVRAFLTKEGIDEDEIKEICHAILAAHDPAKGETKLSQILSDADLMHLSLSQFPKISNKLRKEWKALNIEPNGKLNFMKKSVVFMRNHSYKTAYGQSVLQPAKEKNIHLLQQEIETIEIKEAAMESKSNRISRKAYSRGVDSMFKLTARNQINLSSIADNKSNILISINAIIISLVITMLIRKFSENPAIILPTVVFLIFSLITIVLAILSTRPNISKGKFTKADIKQMKVNLLFFGNFYRMKYDDYEWAVEEMINNDAYLYSNMIKDQYDLGIVLARKYKLLRWSYNVFMIGLIVSVLSFLFSTISVV